MLEVYFLSGLIKYMIKQFFLFYLDFQSKEFVGMVFSVFQYIFRKNQQNGRKDMFYG